jgi:methionyl-tRNA formyltransferase
MNQGSSQSRPGRAAPFDTVVLLTGPVEQTALSAMLRNHNPRLSFLTANSLAELEALTPAQLRRARLISFVTPVIVPGHILAKLGFGAYNFHPGPPHYPGWMPSHFAIYDRAKEFGATAHVMVERVDAGPIVAVDLFDIPQNANVADLEQMAYARLARLFWNLGATLANEREPLAELPIRWRGPKCTKRRFVELCNIPKDISPDELERRLHAFGGGIGGIGPTVTLHGRQFDYGGAKPDVQCAAAATAPKTALELAS